MQMQMSKKPALAAAIVFALFAAMLLGRPAQWHVERTVSIAAPPAVVFGLLDQSTGWSTWASWADPRAQLSGSGPAHGVGATLTWSGSAHSGAGTLTIAEATAPSKLVAKVTYQEPADCTATATVTLEPTKEGTRLTWLQEGQNSFAVKVAGMMTDPVRLVGSDLDVSLEALRVAAERLAPPPAPTAEADAGTPAAEVDAGTPAGAPVDRGAP
jgi:uncharacterized protein YndB with AHSA1/START domain